MTHSEYSNLTHMSRLSLPFTPPKGRARVETTRIVRAARIKVGRLGNFIVRDREAEIGGNRTIYEAKTYS